MAMNYFYRPEKEKRSASYKFLGRHLLSRSEGQLRFWDKGSNKIYVDKEGILSFE
jgi:hypothetical protein